MGKTIVFTDHFMDKGDGSGWKSKIRNSAFTLVSEVIKRKTWNGSATLCTSNSIADKLSSFDMKMASYEFALISWQNKADFSFLHKFVDELYNLSYIAGLDLGLVYKDIPVLEPIEMRWLDPLFNEILIYVNLIQSILKEKSPDLVYTFGATEVVNLAAEVARAEGIRVLRDRFFWYPISLLGGAIRGNVRYGEITRALLNDLPKKVDISVSLNSGKRPRILIIGGINRTVERLCAALPVLTKFFDFEFHFLAGGRRVTLVGELKKRGIKCSYAQDWMEFKEAKSLLNKTSNRVSAGWKYIRENASKKLNHTWYGVPIYPYAEKILRSSCLEGSKLSVFAIEVATRAIESCKPDLLICFEDWELPRAFTLLCRKKRIPTLAYYNLSGNSYSGLIRRSQEWMAVSGKVLYDSFKNQYPTGHIRIVGDTISDEVFAASRDAVRRKVCSDFNLSYEKPVILLLSTYPGGPYSLNDIRILFKKTADAARGIEGAQLIIKTHPLQEKECVRMWAETWGCPGIISHGYELLSLCLAADIVSVPITTAVWQIMLSQTPIVSIQSRPLLEQYEDMGYDYLKNKGIVYIFPESDPTPIFKQLLFNKKARKEQIERGLAHVSEHVGPLDGKSAWRLGTFVEEILRQEKLN